MIPPNESARRHLAGGRASFDIHADDRNRTNVRIGLLGLPSERRNKLLTLSYFVLLPEHPDIPDAIAFVESAFKAIGLGFHPDTPFFDYVDVETGEKLFSEIDAIGLVWQLDVASELLEEEEEDVYGICVRLAQEWFAKTQDDDDEARPDAVVG